MMYDIASFFAFLLLALMLGLTVGWRSYGETPHKGWPDWFVGWTRRAFVVYLVALIVAVLKLLPGRAGLWLELALLMVTIYVIGCFLGGALKTWLFAAPVPAGALPAGPAPQPLVSDNGSAAKAEADRLAARAEADRLAAQAAAKAEADRLAAEAAAKAEADRRAAEAAAKAEADRLAAEAAAKAEADRLAGEAAAKAETDRLAAEAAANAQATAAAAASVPPTAPDEAGGSRDELKLIKGIGPKNEAILNGLGIHHFRQIADWTPDKAAAMGHQMAFPGRIEREHWIPQARLLAAGIETEHAAAVKSGAVAMDATADAPLSEAEAASLLASLPAAAPAVENEDQHAGARPLGLVAPRGGTPDDLKLIKGIGRQNEARLHGLGIWHFHQIAAWTADNVRWVGSYLAFAGRIDREQWVAQARELAAGRKTEFALRAEAGMVKTSRDDGSHGQDNVAKVEPKPEQNLPG